MNKHIIWAITLFAITLMICGTIIYINYNSWTIRFEMDDNTKEAIESVEWGELNEKETNLGELGGVTRDTENVISNSQSSVHTVTCYCDDDSGVFILPNTRIISLSNDSDWECVK